MATPDRSEEAPPQKKSRFSLGKCPNPSAAQKCSPNFARMVPAALATPLPPPEAIRARFETAGLPWMGIDIETHRLVPSTADSWWRPGQFGFMTRLTKEVLADVGYSAEQIESMLARGIAGLGWGKTFLPGDSMGEPMPLLDGLVRTANTEDVSWIDIESTDGDIFIT